MTIGRLMIGGCLVAGLLVGCGGDENGDAAAVSANGGGGSAMSSTIGGNVPVGGGSAPPSDAAPAGAPEAGGEMASESPGMKGMTTEWEAERNEAHAEMVTMLSGVESQLGRLKGLIDRASGSAPRDVQRLVEDAEEALAEMQRRLEELKSAGESSWEEIRSQIETTLGEIRDEIESALERMAGAAPSLPGSPG
ncbi:MAG: hypothetical protein VYC34_06115 [Planctomycetota bacterium]|nr:hypothetical protein [Planctomycetota bacterium]